jgi:hypothetical protein
VQFQVCNDLKVLILGSWLFVDQIFVKICDAFTCAEGREIRFVSNAGAEMVLMNYLVSADSCSGQVVYHIY